MQTPNDVTAYLQGYAATNPEDFERACGRSDWPALAQRELDRRAARILELLDHETLAAIASGALDLQSICGRVLNGSKGLI